MFMNDLPVTGLWRLLRPLLFQLDAETAHRLTLGLARRWSAVASGRLGAQDIARDSIYRKTLRPIGLEFPNPIGLAAGLDKDAEAVPLWQRLGFGFVEIGTVTALPQPGNPRPRLFRLPADAALINRMGFNNSGADVVAQRLQRLRERDVLQIPLGVNIGKSKVTPPEQAADDYRRSFQRLAPFADYVVVNISSPNTPGLRDLQTVEQVKALMDAVQEPNQRLPRPRPVLLKLAPDLNESDAVECALAALDAGADGLVLTNTSTCFDGLQSDTTGMSGGLSGQPIFERSTEMLRLIRNAIGPSPVLVGVGGVMDPAGAVAKLESGADLVQVYTGLIYGGPGLVRRLLREIPHDLLPATLE
ncbi:quinone-dependent dihydroorotate dehydrogenase [Thiohalocapsa marina]|uniref:Dihydroorotate dehydrogenase (quinone) n=2 Tax=Thiohalocapsa marina TaxID=424902 RepID=A0A5M8FLV4_9GAMM|nr:quinone-dependent dihydroorotate dehydrogenase [Thiohalocapsa marina]KAA6184101.1 quinone-dependent dihydroorotate dehydrogenase [Thiohalocapsa marina]